MSLRKDLADFFTRKKPGTNNDDQRKQPDLRQEQDVLNGSILLLTGPVRASFVSRYLMALSPIFLVIICIFTQRILNDIFGVAISPLTTAVPSYSSSLTSITNITILLIAPVGIFILFAAIGWARQITELWMSTALTLGLSGVTGIVLASFVGSPAISGNYMLLLLQWISFLVQPFCFIAAIIVIFVTEKFRGSIRYTLKKEGLWIRGGVWETQEYMIPYHQIGGVVLEQGLIGKKYNFGTVIPQTVTSWGADASVRSTGASGQKDKSGAGSGFAKDLKDASRGPLDCLYGIPDPKKAQKILTGLIHRETVRGEEPGSSLNKIYKSDVAGNVTGEPEIQPKASPVVSGFDINDDTRNILDEGIPLDERNPDGQQSAIIRVNDYDIPGTTITSANDHIREIPPFRNSQSNQKPGTPPVQANQPVESIFDQIRKLAELRDSGIITEQEFTTKKTELLKRI